MSAVDQFMIYPVTGNPQLMALGAKIDLGLWATLRDFPLEPLRERKPIKTE
ncbi:MAG: hypothetical protein F6J94_05820 [Moorea sp. SIO1F2]|uniref:hypothetical protein n=1 Tax=Moorena sp. SIO1F2 TaxID=2607819 RepID=UPI0013B6C96C|nr:hypothetical protein [Moorena sp. SIO1F2]NET81485.1 hypothetical protein [Moorena sp. SIO1F2]